QVTFITERGAEYDVARKSWGFYATPSTNGRLRSFGLRAALVRASSGRLFVMLVEADKEAGFREYLFADKQKLICWLDDDGHLARLMDAFDCDGIEEISGAGQFGGVVADPPVGKCPMCEGRRLRVHFVYDRQPDGEFQFEAIKGKPYRREL